MGFVVLGVLSVGALYGGAALSVRAYEGGRAVGVMTTLFFALALIILPIHVLGWGNVLTAPALGASSCGFSLVTTVLALRGRSWRLRAVQTLRRCADVVVLPFSALRYTWQARSVAFLGVLVALGVLVWTGILVWLAPHNSWDGMLYHEPMTNYSIQNRGFGIVELLGHRAQEQANTAPRIATYSSIWLVLFTDRRLIEATPHYYAVLLLLAFYCVLRELSVRKTDALAFATGLFLVPTFCLQLRSTYTDANFAAMFAVAAYFVVRRELRPVDVICAALALGVMGGVKHTGLLMVPALGSIALVRAGRKMMQQPGARRRWASAMSVGCLIVVALFVPPYVRNAIEYENPIYPRTVSVEALGIDWKGTVGLDNSEHVGEGTLFTPPRKHQFADSRDNGYGNVPPFVVFPLACVALALIVWRFGSWPFRRLKPDPSTWQVAHLAWPCLLSLAASPSPHWARYNGHILAAGVALTAWLLCGKRCRNLSQSVAGALVIGGVMTLHWSEPAWGVPPETAWKMLGQDPVERAIEPIRKPTHLTGALGRAREREIGAGDVVAYSSVEFPARMWNEAVSNRVVPVAWEKGPTSFLKRLDDVHAKWVFTKPRSAAARVLSRDCRWELVEGSASYRPKRSIRQKTSGKALKGYRSPDVYRRMDDASCKKRKR